MNETIARLFELMQILANIATARREGEITEDVERELINSILTRRIIGSIFNVYNFRGEYDKRTIQQNSRS